MDEGTFRNTPTVHPMERRKKLMEADANASIFNLDEQENRDLLLSMSRKRSEGRLPLRNFNRSGKRNLKEAAGRKLRGVKKAWGSFKSVSYVTVGTLGPNADFLQRPHPDTLIYKF